MPPRAIIQRPYPIGDKRAFQVPAYALIILNHKRFVLSFVLIVAVLSLLLLHFMTNVYRSEATIIPNEQSSNVKTTDFSGLGKLGAKLNRRLERWNKRFSIQHLKLRLKSRQLAMYIHAKYEKQLYAYLFPKKWDPRMNTWRKKKKTPTLQEIVLKIQKMVKVKTNKRRSILTLQVKHRDPAAAKRLADLLLLELSEFLRQETIEEAQSNQQFFKEQINGTSDVLLKKKMYQFLAEEQEEELLARVHTPYGFQILDPPIAPDKDKYFKPNRPLLFVIHVSIALLLAVGWVFFREKVQHHMKLHEKRHVQ